MEKNCWEKQRDQKGKGKKAQNVNDDNNILTLPKEQNLIKIKFSFKDLQVIRANRCAGMAPVL